MYLHHPPTFPTVIVPSPCYHPSKTSGSIFPTHLTLVESIAWSYASTEAILVANDHLTNPASPFPCLHTREKSASGSGMVDGKDLARASVS
jgi:hypothetical protein